VANLLQTNGTVPANMRPICSKYTEISNKFAEMSRGKSRSNYAAKVAATVQEIARKVHGKVPANKQHKLRQYCSKCLEMIVVK
jgi:hypothetical protein